MKSQLFQRVKYVCDLVSPLHYSRRRLRCHDDQDFHTRRRRRQTQTRICYSCSFSMSFIARCISRAALSRRSAQTQIRGIFFSFVSESSRRRKTSCVKPWICACFFCVSCSFFSLSLVISSLCIRRAIAKTVFSFEFICEKVATITQLRLGLHNSKSRECVDVCECVRCADWWQQYETFYFHFNLFLLPCALPVNCFLYFFLIGISITINVMLECCCLSTVYYAQEFMARTHRKNHVSNEHDQHKIKQMFIVLSVEIDRDRERGGNEHEN